MIIKLVYVICNAFMWNLIMQYMYVICNLIMTFEMLFVWYIIFVVKASN